MDNASFRGTSCVLPKAKEVVGLIGEQKEPQSQPNSSKPLISRRKRKIIGDTVIAEDKPVSFYLSFRQHFCLFVLFACVELLLALGTWLSGRLLYSLRKNVAFILFFNTLVNKGTLAWLGTLLMFLPLRQLSQLMCIYDQFVTLITRSSIFYLFHFILDARSMPLCIKCVVIVICF